MIEALRPGDLVMYGKNHMYLVVDKIKVKPHAYRSIFEYVFRALCLTDPHVGEIRWQNMYSDDDTNGRETVILRLEGATT